ncbi:unnamed protein product [Gongylonema pulchrum]|uniref:DDE-1 domain-containing protein n=1 Tax=Gongylonema pulchrum TaxID=637853 RepID=A0A183CW10_9BILA|nr:unnamed protein product [Gongylonema pulchrum]
MAADAEFPMTFDLQFSAPQRQSLCVLFLCKQYTHHAAVPGSGEEFQIDESQLLLYARPKPPRINAMYSHCKWRILQRFCLAGCCNCMMLKATSVAHDRLRRGQKV